MEYFHHGDTGNLSLHDMIECDIKSEFCEQLPMRDLLASSPVNDFHHAPANSDSVTPDIVNGTSCYNTGHVVPMVGLKVNADSNWLQTVNLISVQNLVALQEPENSDANLLVNPQTGLPVSLGGLATLGQCAPQTTTHPSQDVINSANDNLLRTQDQMNYLSNNNIRIARTTADYPQVSSPMTMYSTASQLHLQQSLQNRSSAIFPNQLMTQQLLQSSLHGQAKVHKSEAVCTQSVVFPKPIYSYSCLIAMALKNSDTGALPVSEIYTFMTENFPYFKTAPDGWKNSVRHNLSLNKCFEKIENAKTSGNTRKGCLWALNPDKVDKMDEEICKWRKKDPTGVKRSMAKPEVLDQLERGRVSSSSPRHTSQSAVTTQPARDLDLLGTDHLDPQLTEIALQTAIWDDLCDGDGESFTFDELTSAVSTGVTGGVSAASNLIASATAILQSNAVNG